MFSKKKPERPKRNHSGNLSQYGLFDVPSDLTMGTGNDDLDNDGDSDLEAELLALTSGGGTKPKRPPRAKPNPAVDLDAMVQDSMKDLPSDEEISGDENDPDLLNELSEITGNESAEPTPEQSPVKQAPSTDMNTLLQERLKMYETAEANAKTAGENGRARRFGRGKKTLKDLIKQANAGRNIDPDDIPPEVTINTQKQHPPPSGEVAAPTADSTPPEEPAQPEETPQLRPAPAPPVETPELSPESKEMLVILYERKNLYKTAAVKAKKAGDATTAINYVKVVKQFDTVIKAMESGQAVDLSNMPGPPTNESVPIETTETQKSSEEQVEIPVEEEEREVKLITASSMEEALQQRLEIYKQQEQAAKDQGNSSKARRMGRIVKQFEQAIKLNNQGKPIAADELPTPPGYAPLPGTEKPPEPEAPTPEVSKPSTPEKSDSEPSSARPTPPPRQNSRHSGNHIPTTRMEKQMILLKARQAEFKQAALAAKKKGELTQAKEFLRTAKGFDPLIEAAAGGLPVDIASLPIPPSAKSQLDTEYELVMAEECTEDDSGVMDVISRLEAQLTKQLKMCLTTRDHHKALGDVAGTNRFEHLALSVTKDLDVVRIARKTCGNAIPIFHYETRDFSIVKSFTELNDNDLQLTVVRGVNYNCTNPKEIDTYVKFEFPFPQEEPVKDRTATIKDTNNPEYNSVFTIPIQRTSRPCLRVFKRHAVKFEVYSKGGFFKADTLLGTVNVKLQPLETQCELHESYDLMEGRKKVGGKLEVQIRIRDPLLSKEVQQLSERWLVIDH